MDMLSYVVDNCLILLPVLYVIGMAVKGVPNIKDWLIPYILMVFGVAFAVFLNGFNVDSIIQGILVAGATVYTNQLIKQAEKRDKE